jgi:hypothetical protein
MQPVHVFGFPAKDRPYLNISGRGSGLALSGGGGATRSAVFCSGHATPARSARSAKPYAFMAWSLAIIAVVAGGAASIPESALYGSNHINPAFHDAPPHRRITGAPQAHHRTDLTPLRLSNPPAAPH